MTDIYTEFPSNGFQNRRENYARKTATAFCSALVFTLFYRFLDTVPHTGSRFDMEKMIGIKKNITHAEDNLSHCCPPIRRRKGGLVSKRLRKGAFLQEKMPKQLELTDWYFQKRRELHALFAVKEWLKK